jgi:hypothetical protein
MPTHDSLRYPHRPAIVGALRPGLSVIGESRMLQGGTKGRRLPPDERDEMFTMVRRSGAVRRAAVLLSVAIASAVAAVVATSSFAATAAPSATAAQTRSVSCSAFDFLPLDTATGFDYALTKRFRTGTEGSGFFVCDPHLPHRAVVTKVQFSIWDGSGSSEVKFCGLYRSGLAASGSETVEELAALDPTGLAEAPGFARPTDTSIQNATINTTSFAYWLQCKLEQAGQSLGLYGADVVYTITAANG